jgi:uncharacterized protein YecT (DUF1311 family)
VDLYYSKLPGHFEKARACALSMMGLFRSNTSKTDAAAAQQMATGGATDPEPDQMDGLVLAMLYANGEGVRRNLPLARQFACQYGEGIQSASSMENLNGFDASMRAENHFDVCSGDGGAYGRRVNYVCLGLEQEKIEEQIAREEAAVLSATPSNLRPRFLTLKSAWHQLHEVYDRMDATICDGGTGCGPITEDEDLTFMRPYLAALQSTHAGTAPASPAQASDFTKLDHELNQKYRAQMDEYKDSACQSQDCPAPALRTDDRAWLNYRDAWVNFGTALWPNISADQWRAWQTAQWTQLLRS